MTPLRNGIAAAILLLIFGVAAPCARAQVDNSARSQPQPQQNSSVNQAPTVQQCEDNPGLSGCEQLRTTESAVPGQQQGLPNGMPAPPSVRTGPAPMPGQPVPTLPGPSQPEAPNEFQLMAADSVGRILPIYGSSLFRQSPSTFAPLLNVPVPANYVIGPDDELYVQIWGQVNVELHAVVDRDGAIYVPKVGSIAVAGVHYGDVTGLLRERIAQVYRNFDLAVTLGRLRSVDVYVTGEARAPGRYTISSLSTLVNAVFATGGPSTAGSMRHIELKRDGNTVRDFDLYDLLLKGDKSNDLQLSPGDVIYIPPVGPQIAIAGSVNVPAIYELKDDTGTLTGAIELAGGLNEVADAARLTVERIDNHQVRSIAEYSFRDASGEQVKGGDIIHVLSIVPRFQNAVTLRGNVANPGRYPWRQGMTIRDLIPDKEMLLTRKYWRAENRLVEGTDTDYKTPLPRNDDSGKPSVQTQQPPAPESGASTSTPTAITASQLRTEVTLGAPEINWDYAVIQRLDPVDLSTRLIPFSPRKAILEHDQDANLSLESGDVVTVFSQKDVVVSQTEQTLFVRVEGEVKAPGIYRVQHGETLPDVLRMAGGLTVNAYLYGARFTRESARVDQQAALDRTSATIEQQIQERSISTARSNPDQGAALAAESQAQEALLRELRAAKADGRVVLTIKPADDTLAAVPPIVLEDGDSVFVPPKSQVVSVVGSVFDQSSFVYRKSATVDYYLRQAGNGNGSADIKHILLVRANGSVLGRSVSEYGWWRTRLNSVPVLPGDMIVIPPKLVVGGTGKAIRDWAAVASQAAISAAVIAIH